MGPKEWVVMFVDVEGATAMKYQHGADTVAWLIERLVTAIQEESDGTPKFTGDGAMVMFNLIDANGEKNGCRKAMSAAERIILRVDRENLYRDEMPADAPAIHIRIGISTGKCHNIGSAGWLELSGPAADLAARLCAEADRDGVLLDETTKAHSGLPDHRFAECRRRLSLKGVPPKHEVYYTLKITRLVRSSSHDLYQRGLLALYSGRDSLSRDFGIPRLLHLAAPRSRILAAGRTLVKWTEVETEMRHVVREKNLSFRFLLSAEHTYAFLPPPQQRDIAREKNRFRLFFRDLCRDPHFEVEESPQLILDGITCATVRLPADGRLRDDSRLRKLIALQDLNAASGDAKATALWACNCARRWKHTCTAFGLYRRTNVMFGRARRQ